MSAHAEKSQKKFGAHTIYFEPPDVYLTILVGVVSGPEMSERNAAIAQFAEGKLWVLGIADLRAGTLTPEARRAASTLTPISRGTAFLCENPRQQMSLSLLATARGAILSSHVDDLGFFATEAEARAWIAERRKALEAAPMPPPEAL